MTAAGQRYARGGAAVAAVAAAAAAAYAGVASGATPFTTASDVAVSIPSAIFVATLLLQWRWPDEWIWRRLPVDRPAGHEGGAALWLVAIGLIVVPELISYVAGGSRTLHPTLSSLFNDIFEYRPAKAAVFLLWLVGGWYLVRR